MRIPTIVVATDGATSGEATLRWAAREAERRRARLSVIHVLQWDWNASRYDFGGRGFERARDLAEIVTAGAAEFVRTAAPGVDVLPSTLIGDPATRLLTAAEGADLLILGSRGRGGFAELLLGSVSQRVATHAACPVAVIPHRPGEGDTTACQLDGDTTVRHVEGDTTARQAEGDTTARQAEGDTTARKVEDGHRNLVRPGGPASPPPPGDEAPHAISAVEAGAVSPDSLVVRAELPTSGPVAVGVDDSEAADHVLATAFAAAADRGVSLVVVRSYLPAFSLVYPDAAAAIVATPEQEQAERERLEERIAPWRAKYPQVAVDSILSHHSAASVLTAVSRTAQLLVIGSRGHGVIAGTLLGSTGLQLLHHARCPVLLDRPHADEHR
jgi:nucleotide-binding universal stress UspA family protein